MFLLSSREALKCAQDGEEKLTLTLAVLRVARHGFTRGEEFSAAQFFDHF